MTGRSQKVSLGNTISLAVAQRGGIPQGTKLAPLLFAVLVTNLARQWNLRAKYVDDLTIVEVISRTSMSMLPVIANSISTFASQHGKRLNGAKCKDMLIDFLKYKPFSTPPIYIDGSPIDQVNTRKVLGVYITSDLTWGHHCDYIVKRARKRLYALRVLKKRLPVQDIIQVYCSLVRSVLEYAAPVWAGLPSYLSDLVESVQKEALRIIFPDLNYSQALVRAGLQTLSERRNQICVCFFQDLSVSPFSCLASLLPERTSVNHGFGLCSGSISQVTNINRLQRTDRFITFKYT